ncbi:glucosamine-6-phosphate deaminase [Boudabousia liubingyangii]|uniref:Glucosamine-6-phosphate deaminase n=1 Tax=Boudabousia liubingyangii TaxID=1921764 RepID=A0A1Q5PQH5_9ACTO|nr:glucosamine-6-phosphate deaminase [Boudabousia liubingyangii]OKL46070.1 glucosamine-6-phosphate deaminase [Boudabousia liubingyangii]OKL49817.1 glucosamine-6-phosphate deaminase [Boudabousia liubingyangii]
MEVYILPDEDAIGEAIADRIQKVFENNANANLGVATGSSPLPTYRALAARVADGKLSFKNAHFFMLDEYVGIDEDHPERYHNVITTEIASKVDVDPANVHGPEGNAPDLEAAVKEYDQLIKDQGGVDLQILGIGSDGHIAFNEPGGSLVSRTHVGVLTKQTREDNARFFDGDLSKVPTHCVTQGLGTIMEARELCLVATGAGKADAVRELIEGGISALWPATIMQMHPNAHVFVDEAAAAKLKLADYYREIQAAREA